MHERPKKIAMVVPRYGRVGGGERFVMALTEQLSAFEDLQMHVFANRWDDASPGVFFHKVPIITFPRFLTTLSFAWWAKRRIAAAGMDLIHTHERILAADIFTAHGLPHALWIREVRRKRLSLFDRTTAWVEGRLIANARCRKILPVSSMVQEKLIAIFPHSASRMQVMTPGVDTSPFDTLDRLECRRDIRKRFDIADADPLLLFVGMNFEVKGLAAILAALGALKRRSLQRTAKLLIVGKGDIKRYQGIAREYGIQDDIRFAGIWREEIAPLYMAADLFVMLSVYDTFGLTVLEAMAAALPVIISKTVGARDIVRNGENGYVVNPSDAAEVSRRIEETLPPATLEKMSESARQTAALHSWQALARKVARLYAHFFDQDRRQS